MPRIDPMSGSKGNRLSLSFSPAFFRSSCNVSVHTAISCAIILVSLLTYFHLVVNTKINRDYVQRGYISEISDYLEIDRFLWCFRLIFVFKKL